MFSFSLDATIDILDGLGSIFLEEVTVDLRDGCYYLY